MQNENEKENDNDNNGGAFGRLVVSLILAIGVICLIGLIANSGEGRMNIPYGEEARDCQVSEERMIINCAIMWRKLTANGAYT